MKNKSFHHRLGFALHGIAAGLRAESSLRTQAAGAVLVLAVLVWRRPGAVLVLSLAAAGTFIAFLAATFRT